MAKKTIKKTPANQDFLTIDCSRLQINDCECFIFLNQGEKNYLQKKCHLYEENETIYLTLRFRVGSLIDQSVDGQLKDNRILYLDFDSKSREYLKKVTEIKGAKLTVLHHQLSMFYSTINLPKGVSISNDMVIRRKNKFPAKKEITVLYTLSHKMLIPECLVDKLGKYTGIVLFTLPESKIKVILNKCKYALHGISYTIHFSNKVGKGQIYRNSSTNKWIFSCNLGLDSIKNELLSKLMYSQSCYLELAKPEGENYIQLSVINQSDGGSSSRHLGSSGKGTRLPTAAYLERPQNYDGSRPSLDRIT